MSTCLHEKVKSDGYSDTWKTQCGHEYRIDAPMEVGISFAPSPLKFGKFCSHCGNRIELKEKKQ